MRRIRGHFLASMALLAVMQFSSGFQSQSLAATLCVNTGGTAGCSSTIAAAVAAAAPNDTIDIAPGVYKEDVNIGKAISLVGANRNSTIVDATGLPNGIYIDGLDNPKLANVTVTGLTVRNANFEGILVTNASSVNIWGNRVTGNNKSLDASTSTCPGIPAFETNEADDCGEGIHLLGADHSIIANNIIDHNSGGILVSDSTAVAHDNLITANLVTNNAEDCGITLASHPPASTSGATAPLGVSFNTVAGNVSSFNGLGTSGAGAGVGIFDSVPGTKNFGNRVLNNVLIGNGLPGVALHSHTPNQMLSDNAIIGNQIAANHADTADSATPGPTGINIFGISPITGTVIAANVITNESVNVAINTPSEVDLHLNDFTAGSAGVSNLGSGTVNATENWWGCAAGPGKDNCATISGSGVTFIPFLTQPFR